MSILGQAPSNILEALHYFVTDCGVRRYTICILAIGGKKGHSIAVDEVTDIINAKPDYLIIGSGKFGLMKVSDRLRQHLEGIGVEVIVEPSKTAVKIYNKMYSDRKNVAGAFHLSC